MNQYMAVHYNGKATTFTEAATIEAARAHLIHLITTQQGTYNDTMSIVEVGQDRVIYYRKRNNTVKNLSAINKPVHTIQDIFIQYVQNALSQLSLAIR